MAEETARKRAEPKVLESKTFKDGAIYLYRRADYKKPIWFIRTKVPGARGSSGLIALLIISAPIQCGFTNVLLGVGFFKFDV